ncbi:unnamed protein product [Paramecium sonneborni]|uniref:Transmembrane protein n=1 Tax=Paramecium sonneborni TaxID=65129 RepID=A0A8S1QDN6_9CILI|nr:unnamed protein product [Paramecium sonneborni]
MNLGNCLKTKVSMPFSVKMWLTLQLIMLIVAIIFELTLFFSNLYEIRSPQLCTISFTGQEKCQNQDGSKETSDVDCEHCQFLHLIWPLSLAEIILLISIFSCKTYYYYTLKYANIIKIISIVSIILIICIEIFLLLQFDKNIPETINFNYTIDQYPITIQLIIIILILFLIIAIWIEDIQTLKFKMQQLQTSNSSCGYSQQLLQIQ